MYKEARHYGGSEEHSGKLSEHFLLGSLKTGKKTYMPFPEALKLAKDLQRDNPAEPKKLFMRDLRNRIAELLELGADDGKRLKIYTAVGTPLDFYHHTDMFVELEDETGQASKITTGDASINAVKITNNETKADVLIDEIPDPMENEREYKDKVDEIARRFVDVLKSKTFVGGKA